MVVANIEFALNANTGEREINAGIKHNGAITTNTIADSAVTGKKISQAVATGTVNVTTTGIKTVSGLPFKPTYVQIIGQYELSITGARTSVGGFTESEQWVVISIATSSNVLTSSTEVMCAWVVTSDGGTTLNRVERNSITNDGFTLNVVTADNNILKKVRYVAYA